MKLTGRGAGMFSVVLALVGVGGLFVLIVVALCRKVGL